MIDPGPARCRRDGEVDARIFELPLRVVILEDARRRSEQRGIEPDALLQVVHGYVDVKSFHAVLLSRLRALAGAQLRPPQQFSVRYPTRSFMLWKSAL